MIMKQVTPPINDEIRSLLGDSIVDSWNQDRVNQWLEQKGWGHFASTFEKHGICHERFFEITLAELVEYLPRTMTTYYERRRLLNEIRSLIPTTPGQQQKPAPSTPKNISINTNLYDYKLSSSGSYKSPMSIAPRSISPRTSSDNNTLVDQISTRDSGIGYLSLYSASSSSPSPTASPSSEYPALFTKKTSSPTRSSYSPKAAFHKIKNTFRSHPRDEEDRKPTRTPDKISKFWANYASWHTPQQQINNRKPSSETKVYTDQKIQITRDRETWYSLNVTDLRDPVVIKRTILNRMNLLGDHYYYFHENGAHPDTPMDPQELTYLCSIADHSASQRILVKSAHVAQNQKMSPPLATPELGQSPTDITPQQTKKTFRPLCRKQATRPQQRGVQLSDPPNQGLWAVAPPKQKFWGERPPAQVVVEHMEQYFDSQDLDKEVPIEPTVTKSIRLVAREASRKYKSRTMLRRKSTKLWGHKVTELKSRSAQVIARLPSVSEHISLTNQVQWIRGKLIGKGSFGRVYLAFNVATGEVIAVKQVEIPKTASDLLNEQQHDMVEALYQEIMMLKDLDHENIVQYLGYGHDEAEGVIHIFLEYVSGGSVASRLTLHGAFDEPLTKYFTRQICSGLEYLHKRHILHRDIKAANILVEVDGVCKISDFGLSKKNDYDEVYDENSRMSLRGSVYWMAPEVVKNEPYSAKVDIWSLGCTVIEMLTGQRPWMELNQIAALYNLGRLNAPAIPENISDEAKDFLKQCFIIDPLKRPTASDLLKHPFLQIDKAFQFKNYVDKGKI